MIKIDLTDYLQMYGHAYYPKFSMFMIIILSELNYILSIESMTAFNLMKEPISVSFVRILHG